MTKCGFVAMIGAPNAGKSTLVNALVGSKVVIVSHKVQTTRAMMRGIFMKGDAQIVLMDTPGLFKPKRKLDNAMVEAAWGAAQGADVVAFLLDARRGLTDDHEGVLEKLKHTTKPKLLVLNKIDTVEKESLLKLAQELNELVGFEQTFMVSALKGHGLETLKETLATMAPEGPWHFDEDDMSDVPQRMLASEITREKMILRLHDELPYISTVETETWEEKKDGSVKINQVIYVTHDRHKKIVIGEKGQTIKIISTQARQELEQLFERKVHLFLFVKVREKWLEDPERFAAMGLEK